MLVSRRSARYPRKSCTQTISSSRRTRAGLEIDGGALSRSWSKLHLTLGQKFCHPVNSTCPILVTARHLFPLPSIASDTMGWKPFLKGEFSVLITCIFPRFCCAFFFKVQTYWAEGKRTVWSVNDRTAWDPLRHVLDKKDQNSVFPALKLSRDNEDSLGLEIALILSFWRKPSL